jgi:hypothetical protein
MITVHGRKGKKARCFRKAGGGKASSSAVQPLKVVTARARETHSIRVSTSDGPGVFFN